MLTFETLKDNFMKTIFYTYKKSPHFSEIYNLLSEIFNYNNLNVAEFNSNSLKIICSFIGIETKFIMSSFIDKNNNLKGQERVIEINSVLGADYYINLIGGIGLYSQDTFQEHEITLKFIKMNDVKYSQFTNEFIPSLSIIDILMFNSKDRIHELLNEYELI
jgi:hypothetical protein